MPDRQTEEHIKLSLSNQQDWGKELIYKPWNPFLAFPTKSTTTRRALFPNVYWQLKKKIICV